MNRGRQRGAVLMLIVTVILAAVAYVMLKALNSSTEAGRDQSTAANLSKAKEALLGYAVSNRYLDATQTFGYLPLPDLGSSRNSSAGEGATAGSFAGNTNNLTVVGRFPWRFFGLPPLRDSSGECLWYAVSGSFQSAQKIPILNWDTLGQFETYQSSGTAASTTSLIGTNYHQMPAAIIFAAGSPLGQTRTVSGTDTVTECGGNYDARNYLDTYNANPSLNNIVNYLTGTNNSTGTYNLTTRKAIFATPVTDINNDILVNDIVFTLTPQEIFNVIKNRNDFAGFINTTILDEVKNQLSAMSPAPATLNFNTIPATETAGGTTTGSLEIGRVPSSVLFNDDTRAWQDNLLYARCTSGSGCLTVNGTADCKGVLIFPGERLAGISRASSAEKNTWSNYLEDPVLTDFTNGAITLTGAATYSTASSTTDVLLCIPATGPTEYSFASNFASFTVAGAGATQNMGPNTLTIASAAGTAGGCLWLPSMIGLAGKTVRSYFDFQFSTSDPVGGADRGNGFTLDIVDSTWGSPTASCGLDSHMGAFEITDGTLWAAKSFIIETDVRRDVADSDPASNHAAIMAYGNLQHSATNGNPTVACDGSAAGCSYATTNIFEESPAPTSHSQRLEIHSGCDSSCGTCNPASHLAPNNYVKIDVWVDCAGCNDVTADFGATPSMQRCIVLDPAMDSSYIALTGGFRTGASSQGVTLSNFILRSE